MMLSVVIPSYNEEKRLPATVQAMTNYFRKQNIKYELLIVDDGSRDNTAGVIDKSNPHCRVIRYEKNRGKGYAVRRGLSEAKGEWILISDADMSTPIEEYDRLKKHCADYDFIIGSRALVDSQVQKAQKWYRQNMGRSFNILVKIILYRDFNDTQCGFKLIRNTLAKRCIKHLQIDGFAYDVELIQAAKEQEATIGEFPVIWINDEGSKVHIIRDSVKMFLQLLKIWNYRRQGKYKPND